jgi:ABC-2 type transport system permease protein
VNLRGVVRARARLVVRAWLAGRGRRRGPFGALVTFALGAVAYSAMALVFTRLAGDGLDAPGGAGLLALVEGATLLGLLALDLQDAVATLIADPDLALVRRAPVPGTALFAIKLADALPRTTLLILVLALPGALAYATAWPVEPWVWALAPVLLAALWAIPLGAGAAVALALLAALPARRVREGLGLIATVTVSGVWIANTLLLPRLGDPAGALATGLGALARPGPALAALSPAHAFASAFEAASRGAAGEALRAGAWLGLAAGVALAAAALVAGALLDRVQSRLAAGDAGPRAASRSRRARPAPIRGVTRAVVVRDLRLFVRDWTVLGDVVTTAALWTLLPFVSAPLFEQTPALLTRATLLTLAVGLGYEIAARMMPFERRAAAWMRLAPVRTSSWLAGKAAAAALIALPLLLVAAGGMAAAMPLGPEEWSRVACLAVPALALALVTGLWAGTVFGDPDWTNPLAMLDFGGRMVGIALLLGQAGVWIGFATLAFSAPGGLPAGLEFWGPAALAGAAALGVVRATLGRLQAPGFHH